MINNGATFRYDLTYHFPVMLHLYNSTRDERINGMRFKKELDGLHTTLELETGLSLDLCRLLSTYL
jgi:hypothetical protein